MGIMKIKIVLPKIKILSQPVKTLKDIVVITNIFVGLFISKTINHFEFVSALIYIAFTFIAIYMGALVIKIFYKKFTNEEKNELLSTMSFFILNTILAFYLQCKQCKQNILIFNALIIILFCILLKINYKINKKDIKNN